MPVDKQKSRQPEKLSAHFYNTVIYNLKSSAVKLPLIDTDAGTRISGS